MSSNMLNVLVRLSACHLLGMAGATSQAMLVAGWYASLTVISLPLAFAGRGLDRPAGLVIGAGYVAFVVVAVAS